MPAERFANDFVTTLTAPCAIGDATIAVADAAPASLRGGQFRVRIDDEIMLVTATGAAGASPWNVTRAVEPVNGVAAAAAHASGASVENVLTAASVDQVGGLMLPSGAIINTHVGQANAAGTVSEGNTYLVGRTLRRGQRFNGIGFYVKSAGSVGSLFRPTVYSQGADGFPADLMADGGQVSAESASAKLAVIDWTAPRTGFYFLLGFPQGGAATLPQFQAGRSLAEGFNHEANPTDTVGVRTSGLAIGGAPPATFPALTMAALSRLYDIPAMWLRGA